MIVFDAAKDAANIAKHGVSLSRAEDFEAIMFVVGDRRDYGETRYRAYGHLDGKPHCLVLTDRDGVLQAISLRRAHEKEMKRHVPQG